MDDQFPTFEGSVCPLPLKNETTIVLGHGSGGLMTHNLIQEVFQAHFQNSFIKAGNDFANTPIPENYQNGKLSISTDGHIISPIFYPGGDIGRLAICGTVNDISMSGSNPLYITASFILEEGLQIADLNKIVLSMQETAEEAGVEIVAGDTKVVEKGKGDGIFISTTGIGWLPDHIQIRGDLARPGDVILISGTIGDHGIAVLSARGDLGFETDLQSDVAPLNHLIQSLITEIPEIHVLRDPTRGGLATTLNEIARQSNVGLMVYDELIPINSTVQSACEMLGFDPLYVANEGKVVVILSKEYKQRALEIMKSNVYGKNAAFIGEVVANHSGHVVLKTSFGTTRMLEMMAGEMLPRIC
ncbi:MAG: hydrogenase expression/formation protein HypE [Chloroflexi bacterium HGW-Chloroflexi-3]|nr:MAG: hydrogenase expression/formation protein HypE [Chloroflexi bacterium HGW-Chloroflexi-3]